MNSVGAEIIVEGFVQGVGYRYFTYKIANSLYLNGWVKNNPDSSVSIYVEGERGRIEELISQLKVGPRAAQVADVKVLWKKFSGEYKSFEVIG